METTRYLGHCQICEAEQKLGKDGEAYKLVHHGYKRPGDGYIYGSCPGVHAEPYEKSCELVKAWLASTIVALAEAKARVERWESRTVTHFLVESWSRTRPPRDFAVGVTEFYDFHNAYGSKTDDAKRKVRHLEDEVKRLTKRVADWKLSEVEFVTEEVRAAEARAAVAARNEVRRQARVAKEEKKAAYEAKKAALAAKREAIRLAAAAKFVALAAKLEAAPEAEKAAVKTEAYEAWGKFWTKAVRGWLYARDLGCDEALIALSLADREPIRSRGDGSTYVNYRYLY